MKVTLQDLAVLKVLLMLLLFDLFFIRYLVVYFGGMSHAADTSSGRTSEPMPRMINDTEQSPDPKKERKKKLELLRI
jgi:hypothetical protein